MYPVDRRKLAFHINSLFSSLRKTAKVLQVSHTTVWRWLRNPERAKYPSQRKGANKAQVVRDTIKASIEANPFVSLSSLRSIVKEVLKLEVSRELLRTAIRNQGFSKKKARFFSRPKDLESKTEHFLKRREQLLKMKRHFVSLDETSFGRHGTLTKGYSPIGKPLLFQKSKPRITTTSCLVLVSKESIVHRVETRGSFNTDKFLSFLQSLDLPSGTVFLLDNVSFHHSKEAKDYAVLRGWEFLYVPPYSPWFNPIEGVFSIVKRDFYINGSIDNAFSKVKPKHLEAFFQAALSTVHNPLECLGKN